VKRRAAARVAWLLVSLAPVGAGAAAAQTDSTPVVLTYASPYSPNHTFSLADRTWISWVEQHSNGHLRIRPNWSGALLSSDQSMIELRHGVADIGLITPIYARGGEQLIRTQAGFYDGARTFEQQVAMYRCLADTEPEFARELSGLKVLAIQGGTMPGVVTRTRAVSTLEDLRGLRLRAPSELLGVLRQLGADPVSMPMGEVYSALAKGVLDGVLAPADTLRALHFGEVAKYYWSLEIPRGAYPARAMELRRWLRLSPQDQALLEESTAVWEAALALQTRAAETAGQEMGERQGVLFRKATAEDQRQFDALYDRETERSAAALTAYGISGPEIYRHARVLSAGIAATGQVQCPSAAAGAPVEP
jgi:TRAP-type C4-dicarboxylate transport system substrate-binding protein